MSQIAVPHDVAAEEAVLGSVLLSNAPLPKLIVDVGLTASAFYREQHGRIWDGIVALAMRGDVVDTLTLRSYLEANGMEKREAALVDALPGAVPAAGAVLAYAKRVMELAEWRQVLAASYELQLAVLEESAEKRHAGEAMLATARRSRGDTHSPEALAEDIWQHFGGEAASAWQTPWLSLNDALGGGLRAGEVTLLGGWTSHGKSVVADQLLRWCADRGAKVHAYINEMAPMMRALRVVSAITEVPQSHLAQRTTMTDDDHLRVAKALGHGLPFGITQVTDWSANDIARDMRFQGWDVCVLDLIHRLPFREERDLAEISRTLNAAAQASGAHLIAVVHLNEGRAAGSILPPPVLRDIRGSGMLKNDADNVLFIHREEDDSGAIPFKTPEATLYLAKCRNGRQEKVDLRFDARRSRFLEREPAPHVRLP